MPDIKSLADLLLGSGDGPLSPKHWGSFWRFRALLDSTNKTLSPAERERETERERERQRERERARERERQTKRERDGDRHREFQVLGKPRLTAASRVCNGRPMLYLEIHG